MAKFEGQERRMPKIEACLAENGFKSLEDARDLCAQKGIDVEKIVKGVQPIAFENAVWAYTLGCAVAIKKGVKTAAEAAEASVEVFMQRLDAQERVKRYRTAEALAALPSDGATIPEVVLVGQ